MRTQGQLIFGGLLIFIGIMALLGILFQVDFGSFFFPALLIFIGLLVIFRPRTIAPGTAFRLRFFGNVRRRGAWVVEDEEIWAFIGDMKMDFAEAEVPAGESHIRLISFLGDVRIWLPEDVGLSVYSMGFVTDGRLLGDRRGSLLSPIDWSTENYEAAEKKVRLEMTSFVANVRVRPAE